MNKALNVLVACEFSGTVRDAFLALGHNAYSCDIIAADTMPERHLLGDCGDAIRSRSDWDIILIHIPCTAMAVCGNRTYGEGKPYHHKRLEALEWSLSIWDLAVSAGARVAMENPASVLFPHLREQRGALVQYVQPWQFGHTEQKKTGLALSGLCPLVPTQNVYDEMMQLPRKERERIWYMSPGPDRGRERSRFYAGIAQAMAEQWGGRISASMKQAT